MMSSIVTDSAFVLALRWVLAGLFAVAATHKLMAPSAFVSTLQSYRLLPDALLVATAYGVVALEIAASLALLVNTRMGSTMALGLLAVYSLAILVNLLRGRRDIDCGCAGPAVRQTLSYWLVARNALFIGLALLTLVPESPRVLSLLDWFIALGAAATFLLIHFAANQIAFVSNRYGRIGRG